MQTSDRDEFNSLHAKLCAGFNVPATQDREAAYWTGLAKMSLLQFARCIDFALGENGPSKMPTTGFIWTIHKTLRSSSTTYVQPAQQIQPQDHIHLFANRLLFLFLSHRSGLGSIGLFEAPRGMRDCKASAELTSCMKIKNEMVAFFCELTREHDPEATPFEFVKRFVHHLKKVTRLEERTLAAFRAMLTSADTRIPFPAYMARELDATESAAV